MLKPSQRQTLSDQYTDQSWLERFSSNHEFSLAFGISLFVNLLIFLTMAMLFTVGTEKDRTAVDVEIIRVAPSSKLENTESQNSPSDNELVFEEAKIEEATAEIEEPENIENLDVSLKTQISAGINDSSYSEFKPLGAQSAANERIESAIEGLTVEQPGQLRESSKSNSNIESDELIDADQTSPQYNTRTRGRRKNALKAGGGNAASEQAVANALNWLAKHQNRNGSWSFNHTVGDRCSNFSNPGSYQTKTAATGLALLPFLTAGHTHQNKSKYKKTVAAGLQYLVKNQQLNGALADTTNHSTMYSHGIAACAIAEAYGMTHDKWLAQPAQRAVDFIVKSQDFATGGWRYTPGQDSDTSVVGWQVMCLKSALAAKLIVNPDIGLGVTKWLDSVQYDFPKDNQKGIGSKYGYHSSRSGTSATSSIGLLCRIYLGTPQTDPGLQLGASYFANLGPHQNNMYANYYTTMFMYQCDGPKGNYWNLWNRSMRDQLIATQVRNGMEKGSWFFSNSWNGGRVYDTALSALTLEVYYRYRLFYGK